MFERIAASDEALAEVTAANGTVSRLSDGADIAPETLIRNGPEPPVDSGAVPPVGPKVTGPSRPAR